MVRRLRRILLLAAVIGAVAMVVRKQAAARRPLTPPSPPAWPPIRVPTPEEPFAARAVADAAPAAARDADVVEPAATWVLPIDGACPPGYPIKANDRSRIYHVPGGRSYERTVAERCYANTDDAAADGYRAAKA